MRYNVTLPSQDITIQVESGTNLMELLRTAGFAPESPCGGNGGCGKCGVIVDGESALSCQYLIQRDIVVELPPKEDTCILTAGTMPAIHTDPIKSGYLVAFDLGTTTVVCFLLDAEGNELTSTSMVNPQKVYGADVITRIQHALSGKMETLTELIRSAMISMIEDVSLQAGVSLQDIAVISVVGNPCMQQLFLGISPENLAAVPFTPVITKTDVCAGVKYFPNCPNACLLIVPDISGYIGADTLAGIIASGIHHAEDIVLMVDIGTNGELVLSCKGSMTACATAAGPALEGANIHFGMRGAPGAVDHVSMEDGKLRYTTIGGAPPIGICGSGLIDATAVMLDCGILNHRGRIQTEEELNGQRIFRICDGIYLTQDDVDQIQLAKGAIAAGIKSMAHNCGIEVEEIDRVLLAGAFGSFLNPRNACRINMLPPSLSERVTAVGNIAGSGAKMLACDKTQLDLAQSLLQRIEYFELAKSSNFRRFFAKGMRF